VAIAIIVPFFAAFGAGGFWLKMQVYHEVPEVRFGHEYLLMLEGTTAESNKVWSSQNDINDALGATTPPIARYTPVDYDNNGRPDLIKLQFSMPVRFYNIFTLTKFEISILIHEFTSSLCHVKS